MKIQLRVSNESDSIAIEKMPQHENYKISSNDGQAIWMSEDEMRELKYMITDILEHVHKQDWGY